MKKFYFALAALAMGASAFAQDIEYHIVGANINGVEDWNVGVVFTPVEGEAGIYSASLETLGSGFKINDGTWSNDEANFGSAGSDDLLTLGETFELTVGGSSGNISFDGIASVSNATVTFDANNATIVVEGEATGEIKWYIAGDFNGYAIEGENAVELTLENNVLSGTVDLVYDDTEGAANAFKITNTGWGKQYGKGEFSVEEINAENLSTELAEVGSDDAMPIHLEGSYVVTFDLGTLVVTFAPAAGVADIAVDADAAVVYYNLQGIRVDNPVAGNIYIAKQGNVVTKVVK